MDRICGRAKIRLVVIFWGVVENVLVLMILVGLREVVKFV